MNKKLIIGCLMLLGAKTTIAQTDTLYINGDQVPGIVKEVTTDAVKFTYPGEDLINTVYKNSIQKVVFKSGRVQSFSESSSFKQVKSVEDFENVSVTAVEGEIKGLYKIGDVSSKAKGTTTLSNQERVKQRAYRKLKIGAAMMGANLVYLTNQRTEGNKWGGYYQSGSSAETNLTGLAYSSYLPSYEQFLKLIKDRKAFDSNLQYKLGASSSDYKKEEENKLFQIQEITNENGTISITGDLAGENKYKNFKVASFDDTGFNIYYADKNTIHNIRLTL